MKLIYRTYLYFLFIALCLMQNPIGWCCDWLKIPELARRILSQSQYQWLVRAILHQAQGVFPVFVFLSITRVSWFPIIYKVFSYRWVTRPRATCGSLSCNHLNSYVTTQVLLTKQKPKKPLALDAKCLWRDIWCRVCQKIPERAQWFPVSHSIPLSGFALSTRR